MAGLFIYTVIMVYRENKDAVRIWSLSLPYEMLKLSNGVNSLVI